MSEYGNKPCCWCRKMCHEKWNIHWQCKKEMLEMDEKIKILQNNQEMIVEYKDYRLSPTK